MKVLAAGAAVAESVPSTHPWPTDRPSHSREVAGRSLRSIASELAKTATECSAAELPEVLAELAAAQAVALQRIVTENAARDEDDRPLSWVEAAAMSGGLQLTEDWLKKNRHKLDFCVRVSRKKWFISEKRFKGWLEAREEARVSKRRSYDEGNLRAYGEGSLKRRGRIWWLYYSVDGVQVPESSRSSKKNVASALLRVRLDEISKGVIPAAARKDKVTYETLEALHLAHLEQQGSATATARGAWEHMRSWFGNRRADDLTYDAFEEYWKANKAKMKPATIRDYLGCLKTAFNLASRRHRLVSYVPAFPEIAVDNAREVFVRDQDANAVLLALPEYARRFIEAHHMVGWRGKSLRALEWERNVDWDQKLLILYGDQAKTRRPQVLPFGDKDYPELGTLLKEQYAYKERIERELEVDIKWVFFRPLVRGRCVVPIGDLRKEWRNACKAVGLSGERKVEGGITPHDFRRSVARRMDLELGVPRAAAKKVLGHSTDSMYSRYAGIVVDEDVRAAARKLSEGIKAARAKGARVVPLRAAKTCETCGGTERNRYGHCVVCKRRRSREWARRRRAEQRQGQATDALLGREHEVAVAAE